MPKALKRKEEAPACQAVAAKRISVFRDLVHEMSPVGPR